MSAILRYRCVFAFSLIGGNANSALFFQSQMNEEANPADVQRQHDRKEKARAFLERILNEKRAAKKRQEAETARLMAEVTEAAERASRLATECVEQTVENRPQADRRSTSRLKETGELSDSSRSLIFPVLFLPWHKPLEIYFFISTLF